MAVTIDYKHTDFTLCVGEMAPNSRLQITYRDNVDQSVLDGNISHFVFCREGNGCHQMAGSDNVPTAIRTRHLLRMPQLVGNTLVWRAFDEGAKWIAFNPNPHTDVYNGGQIYLEANSTLTLEVLDDVRYIVALDGSFIVKNAAGTEVVVADGTAVKVNAGSQVEFITTDIAIAGVFRKRPQPV